jgi:hypothetical protein
MFYLLLGLVALVVFVSVLLCARLKICVEYRDGKMKLIFRCLCFKISVKDSTLRKQKKSKKGLEAQVADGKKPAGIFDRIRSFRDGYDGVRGVLEEILTLIKDRAEFTDIYIRIRYGTGDAAITGIIYGAIWGLVGNIYSLVCRYAKVKFPILELEPVFGGKAFEIEAEGIIVTRLVHIITAAFRSVKVYLKYKSQKGEE